MTGYELLFSDWSSDVCSSDLCDVKGQFYMHVKALELMTETDLLPCNIKFMIEGEEEVGSEHLEDFVKDNRERLSSDVVLISDTAMISKIGRAACRERVCQYV